MKKIRRKPRARTGPSIELDPTWRKEEQAMIRALADVALAAIDSHLATRSSLRLWMPQRRRVILERLHATTLALATTRP